MAEHNSLYGRDVIEGVLTKMVSCMIHLIAEGNPIKLDGLGIFYPTVESTKNGITKAEILSGKWNANTYVKAIHIRFLPEGVADDNITSRAFKEKCVFEFAYVVKAEKKTIEAALASPAASAPERSRMP